MTNIYYTRFSHPLDVAKFKYYQKFLPQCINQKINRFYRWQDAHASLFGKLLLLKALNDFGVAPNLNRLSYSCYNRPYFKTGIDFNISHSGEYAVCAFSNSDRVGIDIEQVQSMDLVDFKNLWSPSELIRIEQSRDPYLLFFDYWTRKEAVIKANGKGMNIPLKEIEVMQDQVSLRGECWFLKKISIAKDYICHIATNRRANTLKIQSVEFYPKFERFNGNLLTQKASLASK